jgi:hypothetical protein
MPSTPSMPSDSDDPTRRRVLAGVSTALTGALAGCSGRVPGTGPTRLDVETTVETDRDPRLLWQYPQRDGDADGVGYAAVEVDRVIRRENRPPALHLTFNSTVGGIASADPYRGYHLDWFRFRVWPPTAYDGRVNHRVRVEPPGQWEGFSTYYDIRGNVRRTTVELRDVDTQGTIRVPAVFESGTDSLPDSLHCSFTVQASRSGLLGKTVRATASDTLPLGEREG